MENFRILLSKKEETEQHIYKLAALTINDSSCNENLQHQENSANITLNYDAKLFEYLSTSTEIDAQIIDGNDKPLFTGTITADISWTDNGANDEIDKFTLTVKDYSSKFNRKTETELLLENTNLNAVVAKIALICNVTIKNILPDIPIQVIYIDKGKNLLSALEAILYQYGFSFFFSPEGTLDFFDWRTIPETAETLDENHIRTGLSGTKTTKNYTCVSVSFNTLSTKRNELVYFQGNGYDSNDDPAPFYVQPGVYFPYESSPVLEETDGIVYQSFASSYAEAKKKYNGEYDYQRNKTATLLYSKNHYVEREWDGTISIDRTAFESKQAAVRLQNTGTKDAKVYKLGIRADAVYRDAASTVTVGDKDGNTFTTDFEFVYQMETAESIAKALLSYFAKGNFKFKFDSVLNIEPGTFRKISTGATGLSCKVFIYSRSFNAENLQYSYEAQTVSVLEFSSAKSKVSFSQIGVAAIAAVDSLKQSLNEGKGDYVPDKISNVKAVAERNGLVISCAKIPQGLRNTVTKYIVEISRDEGASFDTFTSLIMPFSYDFIRVKKGENSNFDGYPEADDLLKYRIRIKAENVYGNQSEDWSEPAVPDTTAYGTWLLSAPSVSPSVSHRSVLLRFSQPPLSSGRERYGTIRHRVEIRRIDIDGANEFFKPNETDDPNENELFYKAQGAGGFVEVAGDYSQTLPLKGQNEETPAPTYTTYQYRITAVNERGASESVTVNCVARPTSVVDVVRGWEYNEQGEKVKVEGALGAENIYAEELSAISVNLGRINAGVLQSEIEAGETKPNVMLDLTNEEFRVGNAPTLEEENDPEAEYLHWIKGKGLFLKMKNFVLDSLGSLVKGAMTVISTADEFRRTIISNIGLQIQHLKNDFWHTVAEVIADNSGNMIITNAPENRKPIITIMPDVTDPKQPNGVYHLNGTITDSAGGNFANLDITGSFENINPVIDGTKYLTGTITKELIPPEPLFARSLDDTRLILQEAYVSDKQVEINYAFSVSVCIFYMEFPTPYTDQYPLYLVIEREPLDGFTAKNSLVFFNTGEKTKVCMDLGVLSLNSFFKIAAPDYVFGFGDEVDPVSISVVSYHKNPPQNQPAPFFKETIPVIYQIKTRSFTKGATLQEVITEEEYNSALSAPIEGELSQDSSESEVVCKYIASVDSSGVKFHEMVKYKESGKTIEERNLSVTSPAFVSASSSSSVGLFPLIEKLLVAAGKVLFSLRIATTMREINFDIGISPTRYMGWLKGSSSAFGLPLFATPHAPKGDDFFHFVVLVFYFELNQVDYAIYDMSGNLKSQDTLTINLDTAQGTSLEFSGSMQELFIDFGDQLDDDFIRRLIADKHQIGRTEDGYDSSKQWFIVNAKDPSAVSSNAFYVKSEPAIPIGFVYVQFPGEMSPQELFGCGTWQDITSLFAGAFFRAEGGNASAFGAGLQNMMIQSHNHGISFHSSPVTWLSGASLRHGGMSQSYFITGGGAGAISATITAAGGAETRPVNYTIKIWKRTA
ncbi:MAG: hypothetical protein GX297_10960 [Treponema sp.]|nr:hypothetical protein [Treponema sp.]